MTEELMSGSDDAPCPPAPHWSALWKAEQARKSASHKARMAEIATDLRAEKKRLYDKKRREDQRINSANYRARKSALARSNNEVELPKMLEGLSLGAETPVWPPPDLIAAEVHEFAEWLRSVGKRQSQLHRDRHDYMRSRIALLEARGEFGWDPTYPEFARILSRRVGGEWTKETARTRLNALRRLEGDDGPWNAVYP